MVCVQVPITVLPMLWAGTKVTTKVHVYYGFIGSATKGDYNGDLKKDIAVFRPSNSTWYIYGVGSFVFGHKR